LGGISGEQAPAQVDILVSARIGEKAVVADALKTSRQCVQQEAADKLPGL